MSDKVRKFCDGVHEKLETLSGRMDSLKSNLGTTWHSLQTKLDEVRHKGDATKQVVAESRAKLEQWITAKDAEVKGAIDKWVEDRETEKLVARAQKAEDSAVLAIMIAEASIDDAERMILEAIAARLDAEAVTAGRL